MSVKNSVFVDNSAPQCDAAFLNSVRSEINNLISNSGQTPSVSNLNQLGIASSIYSAGADFYTDSGTANTYVLSAVGLKSAPNAYFTGMRIRFIAQHANTGASTVNVAGLGVINIKAYDGSSTPSSGDIAAGHVIELTYDGTNAVYSGGVPYAVSTIPVGAIMPYAGTSAPSGWLLCYGQAVSRTTYATLFGLLSTAYGTGDGSTTFNLPDYRGRVHIGLDNMGGSSANRVTSANADSLNNTGGGLETTTATGTNGTSGATTLTASQIPSINGRIPSATGSSGYTVGDTGTGSTLNTGGELSNPGTNNKKEIVTISSNTGGTSHTHSAATFTGNAVTSTPPWIAGAYIIKY